MSCPSCKRDYELPKRYLLRVDDMDFSPVPRLLGCLHTCCHSCLEEMRERSTLGKVICPVCRRDEVIKGVKYLPLDVSVLKQVLQSSSTEVLATCARCYDDVPSYSWCETCSSALCEFHHQDHKLSVDTAKHHYMTFKEIAARNKHVEPQLPPPSCPEVLMHDSGAYCRTCSHIVSVSGCLQNHVGHDTESCVVLFPAMKDSVKTSMYTAETESNRLETSIFAVREALRQLDDETDRAASSIKAEMDSLRAEIVERENQLYRRLEVVSDRKRLLLKGQLSSLSETLEMLSWSNEVATNLLSDTGTETGVDERSAYLVGAAGAIARQTAEVVERIKALALEPLCDPTIAVSFNFSEIDAIRLNLPILGCIQVAEEEGEVGKDDAKDPELTLYHSKKKSSRHSTQAVVPQIAFSIKSEPPTTLLPNVGGPVSKGFTSHAIIIEARAAYESGVGDPSRRANPGQGALLGQIIFSTETDKRLLAKQELRSFFESAIVRNIPVLKVVREVSPLAASNFSSAASLHSNESSLLQFR